MVIGVLRDVARKGELFGSIIIPEGTARGDFGLVGPGTVVIETKIGAAYLIADQSRTALRPDDPRILKVEVPQEPRRVRDDVQSDVNVMFLLLGGLSLVVGAIGIANITLVSVMERTGEIGLRRPSGRLAGISPLQFLFESALMGVIGGILGASLGVLIVVAVSAFELWTPVLDPWAPFLRRNWRCDRPVFRAYPGDAGRLLGTGRSIPEVRLSISRRGASRTNPTRERGIAPPLKGRVSSNPF